MFILDICELVGVLKKSLLLFSSQSMFGLQGSIVLYPIDWPAELETTYVGDSNIGYKKFCYCNRIKLNLQKQSFLTPGLYTSPSSYGQFNN